MVRLDDLDVERLAEHRERLPHDLAEDEHADAHVGLPQNGDRPRRVVERALGGFVEPGRSAHERDAGHRASARGVGGDVRRGEIDQHLGLHAREIVEMRFARIDAEHDLGAVLGREARDGRAHAPARAQDRNADHDASFSYAAKSVFPAASPSGVIGSRSTFSQSPRRARSAFAEATPGSTKSAS